MRLLANIKVQTGDLQGAMEAYDEIVALNRESYEVLNAKFSKLFIVINILNDVELATDILGDISSNSIEEEELIMKLELSEFLLAQLIRRGSHSNLQKKNELTELLPEEYQLYQNYPNPFNPATTIKYDLPDVSDVTLKIYDMLGAEVKTLVSQRQEPGRYEIQFNASSLASGVYIYQLIADKFISSKKMILLK